MTFNTGKTSSVTITNGLSRIPIAPAVIPPRPARKPVKVPLPATVPAGYAGVPDSATYPTSVPAGGGSVGSTKGDQRGALILPFIGLVGVLGASAWKRRLREE